MMLVLAAIFLLGQAPDKSWQPLSDAERAVKDDPKNPGASAVILSREVEIDDTKRLRSEHIRIKILTEEGRKYADVEIPYLPKQSKVEAIRGRTVSIDGQSLDFTGKIFDKLLAKARRVNLLAKSFSFGGVQKGSVIEYAYQLRWHQGLPDVIAHPEKYVFGSRALAALTDKWVLDQELTTLNARFVYRPLTNVRLYWSGRGVTEASAPKALPDGTVELRLQNVSPFQAEDSMPPEANVRPTIDFYYVVGGIFSPETFWIDLGRAHSEDVEAFIGEAKHYRQEVERLLRPEDDEETRLRKLYGRARQIRNLSTEQRMTAGEMKKQGLKENKSGLDALKRGYGRANEANLTFVGLARAAGFESTPVLVFGRASQFFDDALPDASQLNAMVVWVHTKSKDYYLDPSTPECPFEILPWEETSTLGITPEKGPRWVKLPSPASKEAVATRSVAVELDPSGALKGELSVTFAGQEALSLRREARILDESGRVKLLEDSFKSWLPNGSVLKLSGAGDWKMPDDLLKVSFKLEVQNYASSTGRRLLLPAVLLQMGQSGLLKHTSRIHPVYYEYPYERVDTMRIRLPSGYACERMPSPVSITSPFGEYQLMIQLGSGTVEVKRHFVMKAMFIPSDDYPALWNFLTKVKTADETQIVLQNTSGNADR